MIDSIHRIMFECSIRCHVEESSAFLMYATSAAHDN